MPKICETQKHKQIYKVYDITTHINYYHINKYYKKKIYYKTSYKNLNINASYILTYLYQS